MSGQARRPAARRMFTWDARAGDRGWSGVTDDRNTAMRHVHQVLRGSGPGGRGTIRRVALDPLGRVRYVRLNVVAEAWLDEATGAVVWRDA
ncbi:hypothetical protein ETD83_10060 [Actinomadura soli]|uniref:Uncharacterized protein n=1 Tax=Actinomadura soli TaxID=2508997 RepID=A0A5C4JF71_9ACTN|nr:hypothetical protein [Actinomadura soli]TMR03745.1 hypothetical protein ETD83_10060 [Actinomadura soli]